ncbi:MAG: 3-deoxy-8-phosphooctulonate synthase [Solirubrobacteraceae bacterium]|nr:3-deoxy-8-phosphooctulonate synthase [Solirubrobacteraceae bacterium]
MPVPVEIGSGVVVGDGRLAILAGPCSIESRALALEVAEQLAGLCAALELPLIFKGSFDKANRTAGTSFRSIGMQPALEILAEVRERFGIPVMTDVHETWQVAPVAEAVDLLQIPAFLCRQTDLLHAAGASGRAVNVKKGQFLAPEDMAYARDKVREGGGERITLTERGTSFGYHDLVVDYRGLATLRALAPVVFDATHSVQSPGGAGGSSGGRRELVAPLARAAVAVGVDALFLETHPDPDRALSDGPSMVALGEIGVLLRTCSALHATLAEAAPAR